jgi:hypothetical protein
MASAAAGAAGFAVASATAAMAFTAAGWASAAATERRRVLYRRVAMRRGTLYGRAMAGWTRYEALLRDSLEMALRRSVESRCLLRSLRGLPMELRLALPLGPRLCG